MSDKELLDYYWKYFEMHSKQRMQIINFYISIEIVLIGGFFYLLSLKHRMMWAEVLTCIAIIMMDIVFWGLESRTKELIHYSEECLKSIEEKFPSAYSGAFKIIQNAERKTSSKRIRTSYTFWLRIPYISVLVFGFFSLFIVFG